MNIRIASLILILLLAAFLRLYQLDRVPPSASLDEVSIGYNAYSILKTGADEYGNKFPLLLRAYDDWRPALYVYLVIPFIKFLGLTVLSVRLPSAIFSVITVIAVYFLVRELFKKSVFSVQCSVFSVFLLAISPWHIYLSRLGHEVNAGLAFFIFGMLAFLKKRFYLFSIFFALSFASYQSEKIFLPLMLLGIGVIFRKELMTIKKTIFLAGLLGLTIALPFVKETLTPNALIRFKGTSIFEARKIELAGKRDLERRTTMLKITAEGYLSHFKPEWLFANPGADRHKIPNLGLFYWWEAPFMVMGLLWLCRNIKQEKSQLLLWWLLVAPLPAALTTDAPHAMRTIQVLPVPQILTAVGILALISNIKSQIVKLNGKFQNLFIILVIGVFIVLLITNFSSLYRNYFFTFPQEQSRSFQYIMKGAVNYVVEHQKDYQKIIFSNRDDLYQSYMFFLFYSQYDPSLYQKQGGTVSGGFEQTHKFGRFEFRALNWSQEEKNENILYVGTPKELPENTLASFYYLNRTEGVRIAK